MKRVNAFWTADRRWNCVLQLYFSNQLVKSDGSIQICRLVLADGSVWPGNAFGYTEGGSQVGEVVFNTTLTGYQELLTDPSYKGQFVCYTVPHIGNVGINTGKLSLPCFTRSALPIQSASLLPSFRKPGRLLCAEGEHEELSCHS